MGELVYKYDNPNSQDLSQLPLRLTCICEPDAFSYVIDSINDKQVVRIRSIAFEHKYHLFSEPLGFLDELMRSERILYETFQKKSLFVRGVPFAKIRGELPAGAADPSLLEDVADLGPNDVVLSDRLVKSGMSILFAVPQVFIEEVGLYFSKAEIKHAMTGLICTLQLNTESEMTLAARISSKWLEVMVSEKSRIRFANHYRWSDHADVLYYLAGVIEGLEVEVNRFVLSGSHCDESLVSRLVDEFKLDNKTIEVMKSPATRLMDLEALAACG